MNVPIHAASAIAGGLAMWRLWGIRNSLGFIAASILVDIDHYLLYIVRFRDISPSRAVQYFNANRDSERFCVCVFHTVEFLLLVAVAAVVSRTTFLYACLTGILLHLMLDLIQGIYHKRVRFRWWSLIAYFMAKDKR